MRNVLLMAVLAMVCALPVCAQNYGGSQSNANGPSPFKIEQPSGSSFNQPTEFEPSQASSTPAITIDPVLAGPPKSKERLEGERLGLILGKAIVDYAIVGFGVLIGILVVNVLTKKPRKVGTP